MDAAQLPDFDAGLNSSSAWTEHLDSSLSDDDLDHAEPSPARALYAFDGKSEFHELTVDAGDDLFVLEEHLPDGWSLVKTSSGDVGLLPRTYYTFTSEFKRDASTASTIKPSPAKSETADQLSPLPILPQNTGEWRGPSLPNLRQTLLGGKSLNRFSSFVTSGAEDFIINGFEYDNHITPDSNDQKPDPEQSHHRLPTSDIDIELAHADLSSHFSFTADPHKLYVDSGPSWKPSKTPPFKVLVHSPSKRTSVLSSAYTVYSVTSIFDHPSSTVYHSPQPSSSSSSRTSTPTPINNPIPTLTVLRRFTHFVLLHTTLSRLLPALALPPLPPKQYSGRLSASFVEARRGDLERYLNTLIAHPVIRSQEVLMGWLGCEKDQDLIKLLRTALSQTVPNFFSNVYHPLYNLDLEDAEIILDTFPTHLRAVSRGVQDLRKVLGGVRCARVEMSKADRTLSYALLSLITSRYHCHDEHKENEEDTVHNKGNNKRKGLINNQNAWCWRDDCRGCLKLTKSIQKTAETLQSVADLWDDHARRTQLATHETLKLLAHPDIIYTPIISTHAATVERYAEALASAAGTQLEAESMPRTSSEGANKHCHTERAARCETVLNVTMAEMDIYHSFKTSQVRNVLREYVEDEIRVHEEILSRLRTAYSLLSFTAPTPTAAMGIDPDSPRIPSLYERDLFPSMSSPTSPIITRTTTTSAFSSTMHTVGRTYTFSPSSGEVQPVPLLQPSAHIYDSLASSLGIGMTLTRTGVGLGIGGMVRGISGVGLSSLLGSSSSKRTNSLSGTVDAKRGSVLGKWWVGL